MSSSSSAEFSRDSETYCRGPSSSDDEAIPRRDPNMDDGRPFLILLRLFSFGDRGGSASRRAVISWCSGWDDVEEPKKLDAGRFFLSTSPEGGVVCIGVRLLRACRGKSPMLRRRLFELSWDADMISPSRPCSRRNFTSLRRSFNDVESAPEM
jgi:hypothetical protein